MVQQWSVALQHPGLAKYRGSGLQNLLPYAGKTLILKAYLKPDKFIDPNRT
jgi:hypothetical protein